LAAGVLFLSACSGQIANTNWVGLSTDGDSVYLAFGPRVLAFDPDSQSQKWLYPAEAGAVQFYSAPSVQEDRVIFGDYGRAGGFFSPRVTVSIYAVQNDASGTPGELWINSESATDKIVAPPLQVDDKVFVGTADNHILALDAASGAELWDVETQHAIWGQPSYQDGTLFVTSMDWTTYALDAETGDVRWQAPLGGALPSSPILGEGLVYISSFDGNVHALDLATGEMQWAAPALDWVWGAPALADGVLYYSDIQGNLYAADAQTGEQIWTQETNTSVQTSPVVVGERVYIGAQATGGDAPTGSLTAYSTEDGSQLWSQTTSAPLLATPVVVGDDTIVVGLQNADRLLIGFDLADGRELWHYTLPE
jgi:outer membrane protein assembly factor BamB